MAGEFDSTAMQASRERLAELLNETVDERQSSKEHLQRVIEELSSGLEELLVAEEELRVQAADLEASTIAIDAERERYGELFEFAPDAYLVTDEHGKIQEANSGASRMLGVPARFLEGKLLVSFVADAVRRELRDLLAHLATTSGAVYERYLRLQPREGSPFEAEVHALSGTSPQTHEHEIRWMVRDITQRLRLEEEVRSLHAEVELLTSLARVARLTASPEPPESLLDRVGKLTAHALPGCEVSVALAAGDSAQFPTSTGERSHRLDEAEQQSGDGPCLTAMRENLVVTATIEECVVRWSGFGTVAVATGLHQAHGYPISTTSGRTGALNVYAFRELTDVEHSLIPHLADQVAVALDNLDLYESAHTLAGHLERALESRGVIEQAKGILMAQQGCDGDEAFDILRRASQRMNRKLRDVASDLVAQVGTNPARRAPQEATRDVEREASIARAAQVQDRAQARHEEERHRAEDARGAGRQGSTAMAAQATDVHQRAAALQRRHQAELDVNEVSPDAES